LPHDGFVCVMAVHLHTAYSHSISPREDLQFFFSANRARD